MAMAMEVGNLVAGGGDSHMREIMNKVHEILGVHGQVLGLRVAADSNCGSGGAIFKPIWCLLSMTNCCKGPPILISFVLGEMI